MSSSSAILVNDSQPVMLSRERIETCIKIDAVSLARKLALTCAGAIGAAVGDIDVAEKAIIFVLAENPILAMQNA
jgi:hypothetical protein